MPAGSTLPPGDAAGRHRAGRRRSWSRAGAAAGACSTRTGRPRPPSTRRSASAHPDRIAGTSVPIGVRRPDDHRARARRAAAAGADGGGELYLGGPGLARGYLGRPGVDRGAVRRRSLRRAGRPPLPHRRPRAGRGRAGPGLPRPRRRPGQDPRLPDRARRDRVRAAASTRAVAARPSSTVRDGPARRRTWCRELAGGADRVAELEGAARAALRRGDRRGRHPRRPSRAGTPPTTAPRSRAPTCGCGATTTVDRIRALAPQRILEIGVGTGLLLSELAPECDALPRFRPVRAGDRPRCGRASPRTRRWPAGSSWTRRPAHELGDSGRLLRHRRHQLGGPVLPQRGLPRSTCSARPRGCWRPAAPCSSATSGTPACCARSGPGCWPRGRSRRPAATSTPPWRGRASCCCDARLLHRHATGSGARRGAGSSAAPRTTSSPATGTTWCCARRRPRRPSNRSSTRGPSIWRALLADGPDAVRVTGIPNARLTADLSAQAELDGEPEPEPGEDPEELARTAEAAGYAVTPTWSPPAESRHFRRNRPNVALLHTGAVDLLITRAGARWTAFRPGDPSDDRQPAGAVPRRERAGGDRAGAPARPAARVHGARRRFWRCPTCRCCRAASSTSAALPAPGPVVSGLGRPPATPREELLLRAVRRGARTCPPSASTTTSWRWAATAWLSIRLVVRAREAGITVTARQLFTYRTVRPSRRPRAAAAPTVTVPDGPLAELDDTARAALGDADRRGLAGLPAAGRLLLPRRTRWRATTATRSRRSSSCPPRRRSRCALRAAAQRVLDAPPAAARRVRPARRRHRRAGGSPSGAEAPWSPAVRRSRQAA